mgnify:CR=1 FL=1
MFKFKIPIGDWSGDGHGKCEIFIVECNYPVERVRQAYKDSCKLTGLSFNHNEDYTGILDSKYGDARQIATEYEDNVISDVALEILLKHGIDLKTDWEFDEDGAYIEGTEEFLHLLFKFIKLSLLDLNYNICEEELPYLNGYWNADLNVQFGYGLFD